jgi:SAM-dependent methyltransferase
MSGKVLHAVETDITSIEVLVPIIIDLLEPRSVIDIGCNNAGWLAAFVQRSITDVLGIDGDYISPNELLTSPENYLAFDLEHVELLKLGRQFDVALCLECAEHLDPSSSSKLVECLCGLATHVVFSAAVPGQTGWGHKNEQYPDYWQELFGRCGYRMFDPFRPVIWNNNAVKFWYRQNTFLFSKNPELFRKEVPVWDGSIYITRELLEIYVRALGSVNQERPIPQEFIDNISRERCSLTRRILSRIKRAAYA